MSYDHLLPSSLRSSTGRLQQFPAGAPILTTTIGFRDRLADGDGIGSSGQIAVALLAIPLIGDWPPRQDWPNYPNPYPHYPHVTWSHLNPCL